MRDRQINLYNMSIPAFDLLGHPVWIFSLENLRILATNEAARLWLGFTRKELESLTILDIRPKDEHERLKKVLSDFSGDVLDAGMWRVVAKDGTIFKASFRWQKVIFEQQPAVVATISDKTQSEDVLVEIESLESALAAEKEQSGLLEDAYRRLFESAPGKMLVLTPGDHEIVAATDEYVTATMKDRAAIYGRTILEVFPDKPDDCDLHGSKNLTDSLSRVELLNMTDIMDIQRYPIQRPDGAFEERYWMPLNKPVFDGTGSLLYVIHRVEDVTDLVSAPAHENTALGKENAALLDVVLRSRELKASLSVVQEREARLRTAERLLELGAWEFDLTTNALNWSDRAFEIYGLPKEAAAPDFNKYVALVHPADREQMLQLYHRFVHSGSREIVFQHRIVRPNGSVAFVKGVGERHTTFGKEIVVGFVQDMTESVQSQTRLSEASRLQRIAGRIARLGGWRVELPSKLIWSPETAAIHEEPENYQPTLEQGINYYASEHRDQIRNAFVACADNGQVFDEVLQLVTAMGKRVWVRAIGEPIRNEQSEIVAVEGAFQDISELVAVRDEADDLARRLRQTLENISDAFFLLDKEWRFTFVNSQAEFLLQRGRGQLLGKIVWEEFPQAIGSIFQREYERAVAEGRSIRFREYYPPLESWFDVDAYPTPEGLAVYFRDVTNERKSAEQIRLLETAVSRLNDMVVITEAEPVTGPDGPKIVYVNDAFVSRTGYSREEVIGKTPRILQGPKTEGVELERIRNALGRWRPVRAEVVNYTKAGDEFWIEMDIVPIADESGHYTHWVAIERDITGRRRAEALIRSNEERFRLIAKATTDVIWDWKFDQGSVWWNENLQTLFGYDPSAIEGGPESWVNRIHPEDKDRVLRGIHSVIEGTTSNWEDEYRFIHADGHSITVVDRAFIIRNEQGTALRMVGSMVDVTEHREMESKLRQSQKLEAIGQLTGGVAHDFNNLLTVILGNAEVLFEELRDQAQLRMLAEIVATAAERGAELTNRLLAFARKQALEPMLLNVNTLISGMETLLRRTLGEHIDIEIVQAGGLWTTEVDPSQLEAALLNLVINARDAMPAGGYLTIETANAFLDDAYAASEQDIDPGQYVLIVVSDTGVGIPREHLSRVFEPFFSTKEVGKGTGLGLSMVYGFVKQSGGHIRAYSEAGEGTSMKLYFPRARRRSEDVQTSTIASTLAGGSETILVVEDDKMVQEHLISQLRSLGYKVLGADSGTVAWEIIQRTSEIDLLFTDVVMPGALNGKQLADKAKELRPTLKVLFTSGYTENAIVHHGRLDHGVELLSKPYRREQLAAKVRKVLDVDARPKDLQ